MQLRSRCEIPPAKIRAMAPHLLHVVNVMKCPPETPTQPPDARSMRACGIGNAGLTVTARTNGHEFPFRRARRIGRGLPIAGHAPRPNKSLRATGGAPRQSG